MPALVLTELDATVVWLGRVPDRDRGLRADAVREVAAGFEGFEGEAHSGRTRPSCSRFQELHPVGTEVRNARQITILSREELDAIASDMGLGALEPGWLGASMVIEGIPDLSHVPPSSRLQGESGATLVVDLENGPCIWPGREIEKEHPGFGPRFKLAARGRRGVTGWVERPGPFRVGDRLRLFVPDQPAWAGTTGPRPARRPPGRSPAWRARPIVRARFRSETTHARRWRFRRWKRRNPALSWGVAWL